MSKSQKVNFCIRYVYHRRLKRSYGVSHSSFQVAHGGKAGLSTRVPIGLFISWLDRPADPSIETRRPEWHAECRRLETSREFRTTAVADGAGGASQWKDCNAKVCKNVQKGISFQRARPAVESIPSYPGGSSMTVLQYTSI